MADKWFDYSTYMANKRAQLNADGSGTTWTAEQVADAFEQAGFKGVDGAQQHFEQYGATAEENLSPNANFIQSQYYIFKAADYFDKSVADVTEEEAAYIQAAIKDAGMSAWTHYVNYGTAEGINPSNNFDTNKYLEAKLEALKAQDSDTYGEWTTEDVANAFKEAGMNALEHAMLYSGEENEPAAAFDSDGKPTDAYAVDTPISEDGETFTLTTSPDNIQGTSGDDTINGYIDTDDATNSTFTVVDVVDGAEGTDTFSITVEGATAGAMPAAQVTNVEKFMIRDLGTTASDYSFATIEGETEVWADRATNDVTFSDLGTGTKVGVKGATGIDSGDVEFEMATPTDAVNLVFDTVTDNDGNPATVKNATNGTTEVTITATGGASTLGDIELAATGTATVKTLTVNADANLTTGDITEFAADATVSVAGSAKSVNLGALADAVKTYDASAFEGGVTVTQANATSTLTTLNGGQGADTVTLQALADKGAVNLGAGDDTFIAGAAVVKSTATIDGGAGTDALGLAAVDAANASVFANFETLILDGVASTAAQTYDLELLEKSTFTKMVLDDGATIANAATIENISATGANLEVTGDGANGADLIFDVANATSGTSDSFTVTFANAAEGATPEVTVQIDNVETINVVSGGGEGTVNTFIYKDSAAQVSNSTIKVSGANDLTVDMTDATNNTGTYTLDASGLSGKLNTDDGNGDGTTILSTKVTKIIGGSGDDTITVANVATTVDLAKGGNDTVNLQKALGDTNMVTITNASADDKISTKVDTAGTIGSATDLGGATDMPGVLAALAGDSGTGKVAWAAVGSTIYAVAGNSTLGSANVIALTGVTTLEGCEVDSDGVITLA